MPTFEEQVRDKCLHFNGVTSGGVCKAGVEYKDVKDKSTRPFSYPCIGRLNEAGVTCDRAEFPTEEQVAEMVAESDRMVEEFLARHAAGICPHCDTLIESERQIGRCVYASPCNCRLWQGKARTKEELKACQSGTS